MNATRTIPAPWSRPVKSITRLVDIGWFMDRLNRWLLLIGPPLAVTLWLMRIDRQPATVIYILCGFGLFAAILDSLMYAAERRLHIEEAVARLDAGWSCRGRLLAALGGYSTWPDEAPEAPVPVHWQWKACLPIPGLLFILFVMSQILPLPPEAPVRHQASIEPPDWQALEKLAGDLREQDLAEEEAIDYLERQVNSLRENPRQDWYSPASLEATDLLREQTRRDANRLAAQLGQTAELLKQAAKLPRPLSDPNLRALQEKLAEQLQQLRENGMQPGNQAQRQLAALNLNNLQQLDPMQLDQLRQALERNAQGLHQRLGQNGMPGEGGLRRGPGAAELTMNDNASNLMPEAPLALPGNEEGASQIGDLLQLREGEHDDDRATIATEAGSLSNEGGGGEVIWRQDVLPAEEDILETYFK